MKIHDDYHDEYQQDQHDIDYEYTPRDEILVFLQIEQHLQKED